MPAKGGLIIFERGLALEDVRITGKATPDNQQAIDKLPENQ